MKKTGFYLLGVLLVLICIWTIGTGFRKETTAFVDDYSLNDDHSIMTIHTGVGSSIGYIRKVVISQNEEGEIKIDFISAFGGLNGSIAAQNAYEIPLNENSRSISIYQGDNYQSILIKNPDSGEWTPQFIR